MLAIKHILFPVDFSERGTAAAPFVRSMAAQFGAEVTLMSVLPPFWEPVNGLLVPGGALAVDVTELKRNLERRLEGAFISDLAGVTVHRKAELGDPAQTITEFARSEGVDLIMMPTHGYGPFRSLLLGSVTAKVLHDAECPVWTSAHSMDLAARHQLDIKTIVCAVDGPSKSGPMIEWANKFAASLKADLRLVHAVPGNESWPARQMNREFEEALRQQACDEIRKQLQVLGVTAPVHVAAGKVAEVVRQEALDHSADLVVIARGILDETMGRLRTHAYNIIRSSPCPVISV